MLLLSNGISKEDILQMTMEDIELFIVFDELRREQHVLELTKAISKMFTKGK